MLLTTAVYGLVLVGVLAIAWGSNSETLFRLQAVAVAHWLAYNIVLINLGFNGTGVLLVTLSCTAAIASAAIGFKPRSWVALTITGLWFTAAAMTTWFYYSRTQGSYIHYLGLNLTFVARMLTVGGAGVVELVRRLGPVPVWANARRLSR